MRDIRCIVIDDEPLAVKMLENFISKTPGLVLESSFTDSVQALSALTELRPDLVFLDIQMPDLNGLELSRMVPDCTRIIFTTAFKQYAFDSYEVSALDFLLKPIRYQKFLEAIGKARQWFDLKDAAENAPAQSAAPAQTPQDKEFIFLKADKTLHKVPLSDIIYVLGMRDYVMVYITGRKSPLVTHSTMKGMEEMLPSPRFMRVHKSYIVAMDKIDAVYTGNDIHVGGELIHVSDAYKDAFEKYVKDRLL